MKAKENKALLVIDMLNDFVKEGAPLEVPRARKIVQNIKDEIMRAREKGMPVIFICDAHEKNDREFRIWPRHCVKGTPGAKIIDELAPLEGDVVVEKTTYSGFYETQLDEVLRKLNVKEIVVTGILTNVCVFYTVFEAVIRGYAVTVLKSCVAGVSREDEGFALRQMQNVLKAKIK